MKKFEFVPTLVLSLVTCGIYTLYALYVMNQNNNTIARKYGVAEISGLVKAILLGCVTCGIYTLYWVYKFFDQQIAIAKASGVQPAPVDNAIVMLLLYYVPVYNYYILCDNYNRTVDAN